MDFSLNTTDQRSDGIFGQIVDDQGNVIAYTLEHAYPDGSGGWVPKLARGQTYTCQRSQHRLEGMSAPFITFQVMDVPDFQGASVTNILIHWGNYDRDSEGCILVGANEVFDGTEEMVTNSKVTWEKLMSLQDGVDQFQLTGS